MKYLRYLIFTSLFFVFNRSSCQTYPACYVGSNLTGARVYFIKHPTRSGNAFTSVPPDNNYAVFNTGTFNCTNNPDGVFASNISNSGTSCNVYGTNRFGNEILIGSGVLVNSYTIYRCPLDEFIWTLFGFIGIISYIKVRKNILNFSLQ